MMNMVQKGIFQLILNPSYVPKRLQISVAEPINKPEAEDIAANREE